MPNYQNPWGSYDYGISAQQQPQQPPRGGMGAMAGLRGLLGNPDLAMALLANSGYSPQKRGFGEILGTSMQQAQQMGSQREDDAFKRKYMEAQMARLQNPTGGDLFGPVSPQNFTSDSLQKFALSKNYADLVERPKEMAAVGDPSDVRSYKFYQGLTPEQKREYTDMRRQNYDNVEIGGVQNIVRKGAQPTVVPLNTLQGEMAAKSSIKQAESAGAALGTTQGGIAGGIQKKGSDAVNVIGMLDEADKLIGQSTGSGVGAGVDAAGEFLGMSNAGAQAGARLKVLQAGLMTSMPRMEGPQSDADVKLYQQAAADIGNTMKSRATRKAALNTVRDLQVKYAERAKQSPMTIFPRGSQEDQQATYDDAVSLMDKYAPVPK